MRESKTIVLRRLITCFFNELDICNYCELAPDNAIFPYTVWEIREVMHQEGFSKFVFEMNVYDMNTHSEKLDIILDNIELFFHNRVYRDNKILLTFNKSGNRQKVEDTDKSIRRKRILFEMQYCGEE